MWFTSHKRVEKKNYICSREIRFWRISLGSGNLQEERRLPRRNYVATSERNNIILHKYNTATIIYYVIIRETRYRFQNEFGNYLYIIIITTQYGWRVLNQWIIFRQSALVLIHTTKYVPPHVIHRVYSTQSIIRLFKL